MIRSSLVIIYVVIFSVAVLGIKNTFMKPGLIEWIPLYAMGMTKTIPAEFSLAHGYICELPPFLLVRGRLRLYGSFALELGFPLLCGR